MLQAEQSGTQPMEGSGNHAGVCGARTGQNGKGPELTRVLFEGPLLICGDHTEEGTETSEETVENLG